MTEQPNILLIMTEQHRGDCLGCEGHPVLLTPTMDNIAHNGVRFSRFYSACPSCIAARRSLISGQSPQKHGMVGYAGNIEWDPISMAQVLRDNGYQTGWIGRSMHQHPVRKRFGYEEMEILASPPDSDYAEWLTQNAPAGVTSHLSGGVMHNDWTARPWHLDERLHHTNWTVDRGLRFMRRRDPSRPFFLTLSFLGSHPPLHPPAFYFERYLRTGVPEPHIGDWCTPPTLEQQSRSPELVSSQHVNLEGEALLCARAGYYGLINHIDDQLRRLINPITGLNLRNTVIMLTSDHGEMLGDHYLWRKSLCYEGAARVPCVITAPDASGISRGRVVNAPGSLADVMPTMLELAGIDVPDSVDGRSLVPWLRGDTPAWRDYVHIEHAPNDHGLTDGIWKYIWRTGSGREQLFNLEADPGECHDLAGDHDHNDRLELWRQRLIAELTDRPEGFSDGSQLIAGQRYGSTLPHAGRPTTGSGRQMWQ